MIAEAKNAHLLKFGFDGLSGFLEKAGELDAVLGELAQIGDAATRASAQRMKDQLAAFEPSITMIGQVKSGKTSLVNGMIGHPGLLPADVNPWTSVVTSLHLDPHAAKVADRATFRFFDTDEWTRLLEKGGRLGELASRAGADDELEKVRRQIEEMREKSRTRLGRRFELLLGQEHDYASFDEDLIERYVCLGDVFGDEDEEDAAAAHQGRFADITRSADLYLRRAELPLKLCIRDTPGVNDTFMMREQITIRAIRDSRICVVVLSAHQALSSVDMALIRLISNIKSREVVIFVNRIDELSDPAKQVPEIRAAIQETLRKHEGPADAQIIFGSAYWAVNALDGSLSALSRDSADSLLNWAEHVLQNDEMEDSPLEMVWKMSGVPALYAALSERICEGIGQEVIDRIARSTNNLAKGVRAASQFVTTEGDAPKTLRLEKNALIAELDRIEAQGLEMLQREFDGVVASYHTRLDRSHASFLERATASLVGHLEKHGEKTVWSYEPTGLRLLLRSAFQVFGAKVHRMSKTVFEASAADIADLYRQAFGIDGDFTIEAPPAPRIAPPVAIGQTIALDIQGNWWRSWWQRRRGYQAYAESFHRMIMAETDPIVEDLKSAQVEAVRADLTTALKDFLSEQRDTLLSFEDHGDAGGGSLEEIFGGRATQDRLDAIKGTMDSLTRDAA
ncbi:MAG: dynamin family protein [Paracoccaceae bacterium]